MNKPTSDRSLELVVDDSQTEDKYRERPVIETIRVKNFKRIEDTRIELAPITYLVGGNNSGKSSLLQAIHTAVSCAQDSVEQNTKVVAESELRYSPIGNFELLGHNDNYRNSGEKSRGSVTLEGITAEGDLAEYNISLYKARNHGNVGVERSGRYQGFGRIICDTSTDTLFSIYVPGISGIPHREEMTGYASVFRKAAGGEANIVFRNIIRLIHERGLIEDLQRMLEPMLGGEVEFEVDFDPEKDRHIDVQLAIIGKNDYYLPIDLWGTGVLQIVQICAYVVLFNPYMLLVDEPDNHLHPSLQKVLAVAFENIADEYGCNIIVSTHSSHLLTAASSQARIVWMNDGKVESDAERDLATMLMDLGALDKIDTGTKTIICTEDAIPTILKKAVEVIDRDGSVAVISLSGLNNLSTAEAVKEMSLLMGSDTKVVVHRDRDFLSEEELNKWATLYTDRGISLFSPPLCDTEAYVCIPEHISKSLGIEIESAQELRDTIIENRRDSFRSKFVNKRQYANGEIWKDGGAPKTDDLWPVGTTPKDEHVYGKDLLKLIKSTLRKRRGLDANKLELTPCDMLASLLRDVIA
ncbi:ATP-dependent nuclease [Brevibacterium spongiae]|uniref:ATP-binding protein n=1 Tax=Brevibacterium spongiae TaxID=2909672 RepID=A0ABY5SL83_9MICO|nr:AAA family ATPase [Brevibacterium spongiae]UVI34721.1 ATP-binding protein [Brevibacterium spongiae]